MIKRLLKFRMWHLLLLVAFAAACLWGVTQYGMENAVVVVEKYHIAKKFDGDHANVHLKVRIDSPESTAGSGQIVDYALFRVPIKMVPDKIAEGSKLRFRYREKPVWIGVGQRTFWESRAELLMDRFWTTFLRLPADRALSKREQKILDQVIGSFH